MKRNYETGTGKKALNSYKHRICLRLLHFYTFRSSPKRNISSAQGSKYRGARVIVERVTTRVVVIVVFKNEKDKKNPVKCFLGKTTGGKRKSSNIAKNLHCKFLSSFGIRIGREFEVGTYTLCAFFDCKNLIYFYVASRIFITFFFTAKEKHSFYIYFICFFFQKRPLYWLLFTLSSSQGKRSLLSYVLSG